VTYYRPMASSNACTTTSLLLLVTQNALYVQENSSQLGNLAAGANKALPSAKKASEKDSRLTCLDGLWEILQHAEELLQSQPDVMAHTLRLLAVMWQVLFPLPFRVISIKLHHIFTRFIRSVLSFSMCILPQYMHCNIPSDAANKVVSHGMFFLALLYLNACMICSRGRLQPCPQPRYAASQNSLSLWLPASSNLAPQGLMSYLTPLNLMENG